MKNIISTTLFLFIVLISQAQTRPSRNLDSVGIIRQIDTRVLNADTGITNNICFTDSYSSSNGWDSKKNYWPSPTACGAYNPLISPATQGSIAVSAGRVNFQNVAGAHENRIFKSLGTAFDKGFEAKFDFFISPMPTGATGVGIIPFTLTSDWRYDPTYTAPTSSWGCGQFSPMDELGIQCVSDAAGTMLKLKVFMLNNGTDISPANTLDISYSTIYYVKMIVATNGNASLALYSDPARTNLIREREFCFTVPVDVNGLTYLQHSTLSGGGYNRKTNAWVDNSSICTIPKSCCKIQIDGPNVICEATTGTSYTISGDFPSANTSIDFLSTPADITFTRNGNTITVTNWGSFTEAPKKVTIRARATSCECGLITETKIIYVHPKLNTAFDINSAGNTGSTLNNFNAVSNYIMPGAMHIWSIDEVSDVTGNTTINAGIRDSEWHNANVVSTYKIYALNANPLTTHTYSAVYPDLVVGKFYKIKNKMQFIDGLCPSNPESSRIIYVGPQFRVIDLGDPSAPDYKIKAMNLIKMNSK